MIVVGIAEALLLVRLLDRDRFGAPAGWARAPIALLWGATLAFAALQLSVRVPGAGFAAGLVLALANSALAWWLLHSHRTWLVVAAISLASACTSLWFNPVVSGGTRYLRDNELSQRIVAIDRAHSGESVWMTFGASALGNLFRALGVHSIGGVQPFPQPELWSRLDPHDRYRSETNGFARLLFLAAPPDRLHVRQVAGDVTLVTLDPRHAARALGITHALFRGADPRPFGKISGFRYLSSVGRNHLFEVDRL